MTNQQGAPEALRCALIAAAQAVVDRWDTPLWKDVPATAEYIGRLRAALVEAQQPAPSAAACITAEQLALLVAAKHNMQERTKIGTTLIGVPTPQADSQPAPATQQAGKSVAIQWLAEMIMSDCGCSTQNQRLLDRIIERITQYERANTSTQSEGGAQAPLIDTEAIAYNEWFNGEQGTAYYGMWEFARAAWMARAARAPADSVTAPAGGVMEGPTSIAGVKRTFGYWQTHIVHEPFGDHSASPLTPADKADGWTEVALVATPTPPAQAADSGPEDAARWNEVLMHVGADNLLGGAQYVLRGIQAPVNVMRGSVAQHFTRSIDTERAARKQGGKP